LTLRFLSRVSLAVLCFTGSVYAEPPPGYFFIYDEGVKLQKRVKLNFTGAGASCTDDAGNAWTECDVAGGGASTFTTQEGDTTKDAATGTLDFGAGFTVISSPAGEANVTLDFSESAPAWDVIGDPSGNGSIAFGVTTQTITGNTDNVTAATQDLLHLTYTNDAGTDITSQKLLVIENADSANGAEYALQIINSDTDDQLVEGINFDVAAGGMQTALNASDAQIGNALSVGANDIVGSTGAIDYDNFDVQADGDTFVSDLRVNGGDIDTGNIALRIGDATTDSITFNVDGTGTAEVVFPDGAISTAEVLDNTLDQNDLAATITFADGDLLDFGTNISSATEGLMLPAHATSCASATAEGQACWEEDANILWVGDGAAAVQVGPGTGGGNSFETMDVPAGTDPVADSSTDTLLITETSPLVITGTAASDTIDFTWSSADLGADGTIQANAVALTTDTTGNYVADVAGTSNEVSVSHTPAEGSTATVSLPATIDLGGKTSFEVPNAADPTTDAFGELAADNDAWAASRGALEHFDGTASTFVVASLASDVPGNGQVPKWNTGGTITWEDDTQSAGSATAWDNIADPTTDGTIAFGGTTQTITGNTDNTTAIGQDMLHLTYTNDAATDILAQRLLVLENAASANGAEAGLVIINSDTDDVITDGILFDTAAGTIAKAINASDADIVTALDVGSNNLDLGSAGVRINGDGDGAMTLLGQGDGSDEDLTINLDDTANNVVLSSSTGVTELDLASLGMATNAYVDLFSSTPAAATAGSARMHGRTTNGFTRIEVDNESSTDYTLSRDSMFLVRNTSGSSISKGSPVYISGATGNVPNIALADADSLTTLPAIGLVLDTIANNDYGMVMSHGLITAIDTSSFSVGNILYVSSTTGTLTATRPVFPAHAQRVGSVSVSGVSGQIAVIVAPFIGGLESGTAASTYIMNASGGVFTLGGGATAAEIRFMEPSGSGTEYSSIKAVAQAANAVYTLPPDDGDSGEQLQTNGSGTLTWEAAGGAGGGATNLNLPIYSAKLTGAFVVFTPPTADACTQGAQIDAGDGNWRLLFDATTDECATWQFVMPDNYASSPVLDIDFSMASGEANEVEFEATIMCYTPTTDTANIGTASFSNVAVGTATTVSATAGEVYRQSITLTDDSCAAEDIVFVVISTDADDATNDDATGDREIVGVSLDYTGT
jgi:hypothetical protein